MFRPFRKELSVNIVIRAQCFFGLDFLSVVLLASGVSVSLKAGEGNLDFLWLREGSKTGERRTRQLDSGGRPLEGVFGLGLAVAGREELLGLRQIIYSP